MLLKIALFAFLATAVNAAATGHSEYPTTEHILRICEINNITSDKVEQARTVMNEFEECSPNMPHMTELSAELEAAKKDGTLDEAAGRFCAKADVMKSCGPKFYLASGLCGIFDVKNDIPYISTTLERIVDFLCKKEGQHTVLAKFVNEGVIECFTNNGIKLLRCRRSEPIEDPVAKVRIEATASCAVENLKTCSSAAGARAQDLLDRVRK